MNGLPWPNSKTPGVKGYCYDIAGSSERALFTPKAKHPGAEWRACLATPTRLPRILAGRQRAQDQGSPCTNTDGVMGHLGSSHQGFHPKETHFKGMCLFLHPQRSPHSVLRKRSWTLDRQTSFLNTVCFVLLLHLYALTLLWEDQAGSAHTQSVLLQSKHQLKQYRTGWWWGSPGLNNNAAIFQENTEHSAVSLSVRVLHHSRPNNNKKKVINNNPWVWFFLLLLLSFHKPKQK